MIIYIEKNPIIGMMCSVYAKYTCTVYIYIYIYIYIYYIACISVIINIKNVVHCKPTILHYVGHALYNHHTVIVYK